MYECKRIPALWKNYEVDIVNKRGKVIGKSYNGATVDEAYIVFSEDNLRALGVTSEYIDYFYKKFLHNLESKNKIEAELKKQPDDETLKNNFLLFSNEAEFWKWQILDIHRWAVRRTKCPEDDLQLPLYYWMGFREYIRDIPELQKFKLYPELDYYYDKNSFLYFFDRDKYIKLCNEGKIPVK